MIKALLFDKTGNPIRFAATWEGAWAKFLPHAACKGMRIGSPCFGTKIGFDVRDANVLADSIAMRAPRGRFVEAPCPQVSDMTKADLFAAVEFTEAENAPQAEGRASSFALLEKEFKARGLALGCLRRNDAEGPARAHLGEAGGDLGHF